MKILPPGMQAHLDTGATTLCWCWRIACVGGAVHGFTDHDRDLEFDGVVFQASTGFTASDLASGVGLQVDNLDVSGALSSEALSEADLAAGVFDGASVEIWRVNWAEPEQRALMRAGSLGEVKRGAASFTAEIRGLAHRLGLEGGRVCQIACDARLGDARCGVDLALPAYRASGTVASADGAHRFLAAGLEAFAEGWFSGGLLRWTSGANEGWEGEVKRHAGALVELWIGPLGAMQAGDLFEITAGCDKSFSTCRAKFGNGLNFRGFPHIPGIAAVTAYARTGDPGNDGEPYVA
jgi:uncharacterized phage protein (TIGR02218 family)